MRTTDLEHLLEKSYSEKLGDIDGYHIDKELSGRRAQVYSGRDNNAVVVHRGTSNLADWGTNLGLTLGYKGKRYNHARKVQRKAIAKYGNKNITTVGHSQGGRWAELLGRGGKDVYTLNKPTTPLDLFINEVPENQYDIVTSRDPVSILRPFQRGNRYKSIESGWFSNPISEHGTSVLERYDNEFV